MVEHLSECLPFSQMSLVFDYIQKYPFSINIDR
jgi:hypothetical protein